MTEKQLALETISAMTSNFQKILYKEKRPGL